VKTWFAVFNNDEKYNDSTKRNESGGPTAEEHGGYG